MELWPPQQELVDKLGRTSIPSRIIGDEMGFGKTIEGLGCDIKLRKSLAGHRKTLIIAPRSTHLDPWERMIKDYCGKRACVIDRKNRAPFIAELSRTNYEYFVCHYEALRLMPELTKVFWMHVITDECHRIKNRKAQQTLAVKRLNTLFKTAMSGTPADNKPDDLWSILNFLYPNKYAYYRQFIFKYCKVVKETVVAKGRTITYEKVTGVNPATIGILHKEMEPFYMRRLKADYFKDLPDKYYSRRTVELLPAQRKVYNDIRTEMTAWIGKHENEKLSMTAVVAQLVRLQQAALGTLEYGEKGKVKVTEPSAKIDDLWSMIDDEAPLPLVIFSQSKSMVYAAANRLTKEGLKVATYTGDTPDDVRHEAIQGFQLGKYDAFIGTIAAGGEGITLTRAHNVVFFDRSWSPAKNRQAEDRLHRLTQKNAVQVIDIFAKDTVDTKVQNANIRKWADLRTILGDNNAR